MQENHAEVLTENFKLNVDNYEGPLDLLLDLAKAQKVDLMQISIVQLADQYIDYISKLKDNLELAADFLVMASWLAYLKSRLLLPDNFDDDFSAIKMAEKLKLQLRKLESIRLLSDQLMSKPKLGFEVFMRAMREGIARPHFWRSRPAAPSGRASPRFRNCRRHARPTARLDAAGPCGPARPDLVCA